MKKVITLLIFVLFFLINFSVLYAGTYLDFTEVDTSSSPEIKFYFNIETPDITRIPILDRESFSVFEDSLPVKKFVLESLSGTGDFLYLVFAIDTSRSMSPEFFKRIKSSANKLLKLSGLDNRISLISFDDDVRPILTFSSSHKQVGNEIRSLKRKGNFTLLYNCIYDSIDMLQKIQGKRKAVIVFSDGRDEGSSVTHKDIVSLARDSKIPVYFITTHNSSDMDKNSLISESSGGRLVCSDDSRDIIQVYRKILSFIKSSYLIKYNSGLKRDNNLHRYEIRFKFKDIRDRAVREERLKYSIFDFRFPDSIDPFRMKLAALIFFLIILFIVLSLFFRNREKRKLADMSGSDTPLPEIKTYYESVDKNSPRPFGLTEDLILSTDSDYEYTEAWLLEKSGPESKKKFPIYWEDLTIGRGRENNIVVDDRAVSENHIRIRNIAGIFYIFDLVSDNGTFLNGKKLLRPRALYDWDEIRLGHTEFIFRGSKIPSP